MRKMAALLAALATAENPAARRDRVDTIVEMEVGG